MKKQSDLGDLEREGRRPGAPAKPIRVIPSRVWWEGGKALWRSLALRERVFIVMGIFVPAVDQVSRLGSLGVMMKAIGAGIRKPLDYEHRLWLCFVILGATAVTAVIQMFSTRVKKEIKVQFMKMLRRSYAQLVAEAALHPLDQRKGEREVAALLKDERKFMVAANSAVSDILEFFASIFLVVVLLIILTWFSWLVGAILLCAGLVALVVLKLKVKSSSPAEDDPLADARNELAVQLQGVAADPQNRAQLIKAYANNKFDRLNFAETEARTSPQKKISSVMGFGSAILMAFVFFLVSAKGAFDENKIVWMVVFIFGLRMVVSFGKNAMVTWSGILAEKNTLMTLARAALVAEANRGEDEAEEASAAEIDEEPVADAEIVAPSPVRIVDYSFSGLNGAEIVSREPLVVEMCVESEREVENFSWSFAISNLEGTTFLITKSSDDCGLAWDLPKGRSRFRVVSGPVWLPAGNYSAWVGIAKGSDSLHLIGSTTEPLVLCVEPDETAKRSAQTRESSDAVTMDVEWVLELKQEIAEVEEIPKPETEHRLTA